MIYPPSPFLSLSQSRMPSRMQCPGCFLPLEGLPLGSGCPKCSRSMVCRGERLPDFLAGDESPGELILDWPDDFVRRIGTWVLSSSLASLDEPAITALRARGIVEEKALRLTNTGERLAYHLREYQQQVEDDRLEAWSLRLCLGPESRVLDVGCGSGQTLRVLEQFRPAERIGLDIDLESVAFGLRIAEVGGESIGFVRGSAHVIPFPDGRFTHVLCRVGLNYMHQSRALREMARVLEPGGILFVRVECAGFDLSNYPKTLSSPGFYGGYTPFSDSY